MRGFALILALLAIGQPALAADLIYRQTKASPEVMAPYDGYAHWQLQARCSGLMKARVEYDKGRGRKADQAAESARYFETEAVARYIADRGVDRAKAQAVVAYYEDSAKAQFREAVDHVAGDMGHTPANMLMTECATIATALSPPASPPPKIVLADPQKERIVCETVATTGSRMGKRICRTKAELEEVTQESRETTERIQSGCMVGACR